MTSIFRVIDIPIGMDDDYQEKRINGAIMHMEDEYAGERLSVVVKGFQAIPLGDILTIILHIDIEDGDGQ